MEVHKTFFGPMRANCCFWNTHMYVVYIYIYISAGPCLPGATRLRGVWLHTPFTFTFTCYIYILWSCMTLFHAVCCILYAVSTQLSVVVCPGNQTVTLPWLGCLDSGCLWWDPGIHWNSKQSPIPPKIIKMDPWDLQKTAKWCPEWSLKPSKSWKHWKCGISWKPLYLIYFWEVGTLENHSFSIQKSSKNMPAMQIMFSPSKSQNISKSDSKWTPIGDP